MDSLIERTEPTGRIEMLIDTLLETWAIHERINIYLLEQVPEGSLLAKASSGGRSVAEAFAHMHNVRLMWLKAARPDLLTGLSKLEREQGFSVSLLIVALRASGQAMATLMRDALSGDGRVKGFKPHAAAFFGYLIAHEAHHRGQIVLALKQSGDALPQSVSFGLWEWGVR